MKRTGTHFRPMRREDLDQVLAVERAAYSIPWSEGNFLDSIRSGYTCLVTQLDEQGVGHGVMSCAAGEVHILNLCVHPAVQRCGLGRRTLCHLLDIAAQQRADTAFLEVRESNGAALALYLQLGFNEIGRRRGYYPTPQGREDALQLALTLIPDHTSDH